MSIFTRKLFDEIGFFLKHEQTVKYFTCQLLYPIVLKTLKTQLWTLYNLE